MTKRGSAFSSTMPRTRNVPARSTFPESPLKDHKRPLQDITERFVLNSPPVNTSSKPRRKVKAPGGVLGAKLRAAKPPIPSSLPPSSPPSASSHFPEPVPQHTYNNDQPMSSSGDSEFELPRFERAEHDFSGKSDPSTGSDPFGFFAVEKKLKAQRAQDENRPPRYRVAPPPLINTALGQEHPATPPTPRKRHRKRRAVASPALSGANVFSPKTDSLPSTPSPSKPSTRKGKEKAVNSDRSQDEIGGDDLDAAAADSTPGRRPTKKPRNSRIVQDMNTSPVALRTRPVRRATTTTKKAKKVDEDDGEDVKPTRRKRGGTGSKTNPSVKAMKGKPTEIDADQQKVCFLDLPF